MQLEQSDGSGAQVSRREEPRAGLCGQTHPLRGGAPQLWVHITKLASRILKQRSELEDFLEIFIITLQRNLLSNFVLKNLNQEFYSISPPTHYLAAYVAAKNLEGVGGNFFIFSIYRVKYLQVIC